MVCEHRQNLALLVLALCCASAVADTHVPSHDIWSRAATVSGVPVRVIHGIALVESGKIWSDGMKRPWPWTLNSAQGSMFFADRASAASALRRILDSGVSNVDIGYMQINCGFHCWRVRFPEDLLDPQTNLRVASDILKEVRLASGGDIAATVGAYHAGLKATDLARVQGYQNSVANNVRRIAALTTQGAP
jgi:hypothetical protein